MASVHRVFTRQFGVRTSGTFFSAPRVIFHSSRSNIHNRITADISVVRHNARSRGLSLPLLFTATGVAGVGLSLSAFNSPTIYCDASTTIRNDYAAHTPENLPPPPTSSVSLYELSFGTVCGLCSGVFIKKGAKALAFFLGGVFVLLQYLASSSVIHVDWGRIATRFENMIYTKDPTSRKKAPNVYSLWSWIVDFLTANFQQRASFVAGFALGVRVG